MMREGMEPLPYGVNEPSSKRRVAVPNPAICMKYEYF